jgi:hypothetical protein
MILGLAAPTSGRALAFDHPYAELPRAALRIGAMLEATGFHPGRSGRDHLRMLGQAVDVPDSRADEVLRLVELGDAARRRVKGYSTRVAGQPFTTSTGFTHRGFTCADDAVHCTDHTQHAGIPQGGSSGRGGEQTALGGAERRCGRNLHAAIVPRPRARRH